MDDETLLNLLSKNPALRQRIESVLSVAANLDDSIELADCAEEKLIEIGRHMNREALHIGKKRGSAWLALMVQ